MDLSSSLTLFLLSPFCFQACSLGFIYLLLGFPVLKFLFSATLLLVPLLRFCVFNCFKSACHCLLEHFLNSCFKILSANSKIFGIC